MEMDNKISSERLISEEGVAIIRKELNINTADFTDLELYFISWLYYRSQRQMYDEWQGYYVWFHEKEPMEGFEFGEIDRNIFMDGQYKTKESIALHMVIDWDKWHPEGKVGWSRYWLANLMGIRHLTKDLEAGTPGIQNICWGIVMNKMLSDYIYFVPVDLFSITTKTNPFKTRSSSSSSGSKL